MASTETAALPTVEPAPKTFHRRALPHPAIEFSSMIGQRMFAESLADGTMGGFFRLIEQFRTQDEPAFCGLGTLTMVLNALNIDPGRTWKGPWRWFHEEMLDCCEPLEKIKKAGITWGKFLCLATCNGAHVVAHRAAEPGGDIDAFRHYVRTVTRQTVGSASEEEDGLKVLVVSYSRKQFGQTGDGHYSPIGGYHEKSDSVLILDVARFKHPPHWVPLAEMHASMMRVDPDTGCCRGFAMFTKRAAHGGWLSLISRSSSSCCQPAMWTFDALSSAFAEAVSPELADSHEKDAVSLASGVMRQAVSFCKGPLMLLTVKINSACSSAGCNTARTAAESLEVVADQAFAKILEALRDVAARIESALGECGFDYDIAFENPPATCAPKMELMGTALCTALVLSLDLSLWERTLCQGLVQQESPGGNAGYAAGISTEAGADVWRVLRPLLDLDSLPQVLKGQVDSLRAQFLASASDDWGHRQLQPLLVPTLL